MSPSSVLAMTMRAFPDHDLAVRDHQLHLQGHRLAPTRGARHWRSISFAFFSTSSMPPHMKKACSG